jgi:hypothetical protein
MFLPENCSTGRGLVLTSGTSVINYIGFHMWTITEILIIVDIPIILIDQIKKFISFRQ